MRCPEQSSTGRGRRHRRRAPAVGAEAADLLSRHPDRTTRTSVRLLLIGRLRADAGPGLGRARRRSALAAGRRPPLHRRPRPPSWCRPTTRARAPTTSPPCSSRATAGPPPWSSAPGRWPARPTPPTPAPRWPRPASPCSTTCSTRSSTTLPPDLAHVLLSTCQAARGPRRRGRAPLRDLPDAPDLLDRAAASGLLVTGYRSAATRPRPAGATTRCCSTCCADALRRPGPTGRWSSRPTSRATEAYVDRRDAERAVQHARLTGDLDLQLRVLREFAAELITRRRVTTVSDALATIPLDIRSAPPGPAGPASDRCCAPRAGSTRRRPRATGPWRPTRRGLRSGCLPRHRGPAGACSSSGRPASAGARPGPALARAGRALGCRHDACGQRPRPGRPVAAPGGLAHAWSCPTSRPGWASSSWPPSMSRTSRCMPARSTCRSSTAPSSPSAAMLEMIDGAYQSALASADAARRPRPVRRRARCRRRPHPPGPWVGRLQELRLAEAEDSLRRLRTPTPARADGSAAAHLRPAAAGLRARRARADRGGPPGPRHPWRRARAAAPRTSTGSTGWSGC